MNPSVAMFKMKAFIAMGNTDWVVELTKTRREELMRPETRDEFLALLPTVEMMVDFEKRYGVGSCFTIDDPVTAERVATRPWLFNPFEIANAKAAPSDERARVLAAVPKF